MSRLEWQFFKVKQAQKYCIKCKCEPTSRKILNMKLSRLSPSNVCCNSRIQPTQDTQTSGKKFCTSSTGVCPVTSQSVYHMYFTTNLKKNTSIFIQATLIDSPPHHSPQLFYNHLQSIQFHLLCNAT